MKRKKEFRKHGFVNYSVLGPLPEKYLQSAAMAERRHSICWAGWSCWDEVSVPSNELQCDWMELRRWNRCSMRIQIAIQEAAEKSARFSCPNSSWEQMNEKSLPLLETAHREIWTCQQDGWRKQKWVIGQQAMTKQRLGFGGEEVGEKQGGAESSCFIVKRFPVQSLMSYRPDLISS